MTEDRLITVAIHTCERAREVRQLLNAEGIDVVLQNINLQNPVVASGMRVRIHEKDLPLALRILENPHVFSSSDKSNQEISHSVLVPVDFTEYSFRAMCYGIMAAGTLNAEVCLLHSFMDPAESSAMQLAPNLTYDNPDILLREELEKEALASLKKFADRATELMKSGKLPPVRLITKVVEGVPEDAIAEYASVNPPILIVMGTRGAGRKEKELIGSVTAEVLDECRYSILAIPENSRPTDIDKIANVVFFTNLDQEDLVALDSMKRLLCKCNAHVTMVPIPGKKRILSLKSQANDIESLKKYTSEHFPGNRFSVKTVDVSNLADEIKSLFDSMDIDMIVLPNKKKKNMFARLFNPSLAHRLLFSTDTPVLAIPV